MRLYKTSYLNFFVLNYFNLGLVRITVFLNYFNYLLFYYYYFIYYSTKKPWLSVFK